MIRYLSHSVTEATVVETGEIVYELSHWYVSDDAPQIAGRRSSGFFGSRQQAEDHHNKLLVDGLIKND